MADKYKTINNKQIWNWTVPAELESWNRLRAEILRLMIFSGIYEHDAIAYLVAVEELFVNIVFYAYSDEPVITGRENDLSLSSTYGKNEVQILFLIMKEYGQVRTRMVLVDAGKEFDPTSAASPDVKMSLKERNPGGLGIFLAKKRIDHIEYKRVNHKNMLILIKNFSVIKNHN